MRRFTVLYILLFAAASQGSTAWAQDARQRGAAADAYDRGTAAYLEGSYGEAAEWFETANRMAPAAPALMQAIRAHEHADNHTQAATLAIELQTTYSNEPQATEYARNVLSNTAPKLLLIQVTCDEDCKLDVDGKLQQYLSFFETPGRTHTLTATFETGSKTTKVQGDAGQTREVRFEAPPPPPTPPIDFSSKATPTEDEGTSGRPLPPIVTWIGAGITGAVLAGTIISAVDMNAGVPEYKRAAAEVTNCPEPSSTTCTQRANHAKELLENGQSRELRTNILIGATAVAAVSTGVIALFLTDWSSGEEETTRDSALGLRVEPRPGGVSTTLEGRF